MLLSVCELPETLKVLKIVKIVLIVIRIAAIALLVLFVSKNYLLAVKNVDEISKVNKKTLVMVIASIIVIFVPTFVNLILKIISTDNKDYYTCMEKATDIGIKEAYINSANEYVSAAEESISRIDYQKAKKYLKNIEDVDEREKFSSRLKEVEGYILIVDEINSITTKNFSKKSKELEKIIEGISNEAVREKLNEKLTAAKEKIFKFVGNYPIVPFDEIDLYSNLKYFSGSDLESLLISNGSSIEELDEKIKLAVEFAGVGTREAAVSAAVTLIGSIAEYGYRLPYYWGGKRNNFGVSGKWGLYTTNPYCNDYYFHTEAEINHCIKDLSYSGLDCSGFVNWSIVQSAQQQRSQDKTNNGPRVELDPNRAVCTIGDALANNGHIVLIVGLDDANKRYIIAEESNGMEIRSIPYGGFRNGKQHWCNDLSANYIN